MTGRVLLVEDSRTQAMRMKLELQRYGLEVEIAGTGTRGLEAARRSLPDVIVLDVDLPELDGYSVCRKLKEDPLTSGVPVVMLTHYDDTHNALQGLQNGAIDYIPKDAFAEQNLIETLRQIGVLVPV